MDTAFRPEAIRERMKITLPDRLHRHQHGPLNNTIPQRGIPSGRSLPLFSGYKPVWLAGAGNDPGEDFLLGLCNSAGSPACGFALFTPSTPGVCAPFDERMSRAASASHSGRVIRRRSRSVRRDGSVAAHVSGLRCISLIIKGLHLIESVNSRCRYI